MGTARGFAYPRCLDFSQLSALMDSLVLHPEIEVKASAEEPRKAAGATPAAGRASRSTTFCASARCQDEIASNVAKIRLATRQCIWLWHGP